MSTLIERVQERVAELQKRQGEIDSELADLAENPEARGLTVEAALARVTELRTAGADVAKDLAEAEQRVADLEADAERRAAAAKARPANVGGARVTSEERTYHEGNKRERSFLADMYASQFGYDNEARARIERHAAEVRVEHRDISTGTFNGLIPPQYMLDQFAALSRAGKPFVDIVPGYSLPETGMSLVVTKVTTGTATAVQSAQNNPATEQDLVTTDITVPVVTILGQQDVSRQSFDRGARTDDIVLADLAGDYNMKLDQQWLSGSGSAGQSKGILTAATQVQTYAGTTVASFLSSLLGAANAVVSSINAPAEVVVMHPRRWHWLLNATDTTGRPVAISNSALASNPVAIGGTGYAAVGTLVGPGLPVVVDANVPTNLGASSDEDRVIVTRLDRLAGWQDGLVSFRFEQAAGAPQTIRLAVMGYSAFTAERYTGATAVIVGTGLKAPTF